MYSEFDQVVSKIKKAGIDPLNYLTKLQERSLNPSLLSQILIILDRFLLVDADNLDKIFSIAQLDYLYLALIDLNEAKLLSQDILDRLFTHSHLFYFQIVLFNLKQFSLLNLANFNQVFAQEQLKNLSKALGCMRQAEILNQENLNTLLEIQHRFLLSDLAFLRIWSRIPPAFLARHWQNLLVVARQDNPLLGINTILGPESAEINPRQSTHTASVHVSVAKSANRLKKFYSNIVELRAKREEMLLFIQGLDESYQHQVIKRCVHRLVEYEYIYCEPVSGLSNLDLMTLFYSAIHDASKRQGSLDDAKLAFLAALYEIQRGYNIDDGDSEDFPDKPICPAGSFNKLMEKLQGIHTDVKIQFLSKNLLGLKLQVLVKHEVYDYLFKFAQISSLNGFQGFSDLMLKIKEEGIAVIWPQIENSIKVLLFREYGKLFDKRYDHPEFNSIVESGIYCQLDNFEHFRLSLLQFLEEEAWYRQKIQQLSLSDHCYQLWARRHSSPEAQNIFDRHYGLVCIN